MENFLKKILESKYLEVKEAKKKVSFEDLRREVENNDDMKSNLRNFEGNLKKHISMGKPGIIAEIKKASPSKGELCKNFHPEKIAKNYMNYGATCLSVLTEKKFFLGSLYHLKKAKNSCNIPVLRKDFIFDFYQIYESRKWGADCVLLIVAALDQKLIADLESCSKELGMDVLLEIHNEYELDIAIQLKSPLLGINNRNLSTFETSISNTVNIMNKIPKNKLVISESGINSPKEIKKLKSLEVNAFLIGEAFMRAQNPGKELARLFEKY
tara:strand:- start:282 stop:1088 length:807 start_codon:yes stop_codon:yes gene_type:complete